MAWANPDIDLHGGTRNVARLDLTLESTVRKPRGLLARLRRDKRGNAMAIMTMSMIPITAMIGSGVDMSRAYLTQSRLQQACDAAALAIRRNMTGNTLAAADITEGRKFFDFNFPAGTYETTGLTFNVAQVSGSNAITIGSQVTLPNKVMPLFGFQDQQIKASCNASQDFVSTDITMVLDVTGSMADATADGVVKMTGMRNAVLAFYDELKPAQDALEAKGLRLRYGFVPYSSTVNVGKLLMAQNCEALRDPGAVTGTCPLPAQSSRYRTARSTNATWYVATPHTSAWLNSASYTGCIEERRTVNVGTTGSLDIPSGAWDLDIDMLPNKIDPNTQWTPWDPAPGMSNGVANRPYGDPAAGYTACPAEARRLQRWDRAPLETYINTLAPTGGTYHDVGMIWGARMVSTGGVFADSPTSFGGLPVNRYIVFMTDGQIAPNREIYGLYGVERWDRRVGGGTTSYTDTDLQTVHQRRFDMLCNRVKSMNVSIWMVVFDSTLSTSMKNCASSEDQASVSANQSQLIDKFKQIAKSIGALRITN
jgi:Flp pilus assembly protein TadG